MERLTSQKKIIIDYLKSVKTHPTAEMVYEAVKKKLPRISRATVYRILNNLKEKQVVLVKGKAHFDGNASPHVHFICEKCDNVYDVHDVYSKCEFLKKKKLKIGKINYFNIYFYGICKKCQKMSRLQKRD